jgi:signal transduction histidine kinase
LTLVRRIVTAHGGSVHLESRVGQGTEVYVRLPCAPPAAASADARAHSRTLPADSAQTSPAQ